MDGETQEGRKDYSFGKGNKMKYIGITYPDIFYGRIRLWLWRRFMCPKNKHLFDEVWTSDEDHYLYCDACEMEIHIKGIFFPSQDKKRRMKQEGLE